MSEQDRLTRPRWRVGDIIRHKRTGHPFRVIHIYKYYSTILIDLEDATPLPYSLSLLPRNYDDYAPDRDMQLKDDLWQFEEINII